jgi:hypothetical protein
MKTPREQLSNLLNGSKKFCRAVGLQEDLITQIIDSDTDWALILKVDALLETAAKEILRKHLNITLAGGIADNGAMEEFIDGLPMQGKTSVLKLLRVAGCTKADLNFIEAVRKVRNAFAHDIRNLNISLIELIKKKKQDINLLGHLSLLKAATDKMIATREKEPNLLKLEIILSTLRFLNFAYDAAVK